MLDIYVLKGFIESQVAAGIPTEQIEKNASILLSNTILSDPHVERGFTQVIKQANVNLNSLTADDIAAIINATTLEKLVK